MRDCERARLAAIVAGSFKKSQQKFAVTFTVTQKTQRKKGVKTTACADVLTP